MNTAMVKEILERNITLHSIRSGYGVFNITSFDIIAEEICQLLEGYVQLDPDQSLPTTRYKGWEDKPNTQWYPFAMCEKQAQQDMLKQSWRKIKEEK